MVRVCSKDDIPRGKGKEFNVNGKRIAIFNLKDGYYAIEALCRHQGGPLTEGKVIGDIVECPWHLWHYNIKNGRLMDFLKDVSLDTYKVEVREDGIYVEI